MGKVAAVAAVVLGVGTGCSPYGGGAFTCTTDQQCSRSGTPGTCETSTGFCAFADPVCGSGERYGSLAGSLSNTCVGGGGDAGTVDNPPNLNCYGTGFVNACFVTAPSGPLTLAAPINTDVGSPDCSSLVTNATGWCVIAAGDITTTGAITATGARPLVLLATATLHVTGTIDIASHRAGALVNPGQIGAGAVPATDTTLCDPGTPPGANGGGAGGSFTTTAGGNGGDPNHGAAGGMKTVAALRGGCAGQDGMSGTPGTKGMGGGAIYLYAGTSITIDGAIDASGAGGTHGVTGNAGGGGGGSGGMIVLDAPAVTNNSVLYANGGGGAEGSGNTTPGFDGAEPNGTGAAPSSGSNSAIGGDGGGGSAQGVAPGNGASDTSGGGGGGGLGVIKLFQVSSIGGSTSPAPTP